jgi:hypothetical protein
LHVRTSLQPSGYIVLKWPPTFLQLVTRIQTFLTGTDQQQNFL